MRILSRYILREVFSHALIGGALFTFILFMRDLGGILALVVHNSSSLVSVLKIFLFTLPNTFTVTIPMAVLVGILLGLGRLAADSEITAMRASGIGVLSFVRIVLVVAVLGWLVGMANSLYFAPRASAALLRLKASLLTSQASFEIQPRVFYEDFKDYVLYVQNVRAGTGASNWQNIFLANLTDPSSPQIISAEQATVVNDTDATLRMRLRNGVEHETSASQPNQYNISTFGVTDLPLPLSDKDDTRLGRSDAPILALSSSELIARARNSPNSVDGKAALIEFNKRLSYPAACLVLMLVGVPLGMASRRGGKSAGFVLTILLVFVYYFLSIIGVALARQGKVPPFAGVWLSNAVFGICGVFLLRQIATGNAALAYFGTISSWVKTWFAKFEAPAQRSPAVARVKRQGRGRFPLILDDYILREFLTTLGLVLVTFVMLLLVFTFFELIGDIIRNKTPFVTVGEYLINLTPSMIYTITPLSVLLAVLVTFGTMHRTNELTAMKATGISLYRVALPVLVISLLVASSLFAFDELYVPSANRRQEALRSVIKGKPAQTFFRPDQKWMFGKQEAGRPDRIFYYQFFDPDHDRFANVTVFELDPATFTLSRRIFAATAHWEPAVQQWIFESGWVRTFSGDSIKTYAPFEVSTFPEIPEQPQYFKKESLQSQEMSFVQLRRYIRDLSQSGFDTMPLLVQLNRKLAYPLITLVMAVLAIPFALSMGRRGSLAGIAAAIGLAVTYWVTAAMFEAMGNVNMLPAILAAWSPDVLFGLVGSYLLLKTPT
ncbi:Ribonuclease BN [Acidisarcina polymorpha]|uniref:Ribonuclease BN n=1 Tax=Acidisarcina polymorpha TaxID=2211140 RepID=A0A2Z5G7Q5_9BACT|nr:LPS export ABC transporter permease LptG [Acidisarcina polymorpha]AXC14734.1 Ribonuclease BN [Acidisarcina polymorpha]